MSTSELRLSLHQLIDAVTDSSVLQAIHTLLSQASKEEDWYTELSDASKASIERGLDDLKNGRVISNEQAMARITDKISGFGNIKK